MTGHETTGGCSGHPNARTVRVCMCLTVAFSVTNFCWAEVEAAHLTGSGLSSQPGSPPSGPGIPGPRPSSHPSPHSIPTPSSLLPERIRLTVSGAPHWLLPQNERCPQTPTGRARLFLPSFCSAWSSLGTEQRQPHLCLYPAFLR